ncbi:hypothetical protein NIES4075_35670 [Tolypothrix sp. NIES-4075]|uniref:hypothetical protein n=1 Tax=Tolypothrix sp. NIES-4075 TaxID=2005459 RepID=UPI000B70BBA3|nr:hypothetical protein [Tolypothrix sp. NIES-4075]GAX42565.1 hypothetical protein NIES4075_35670 [Tolypothrix sp. NIES-4075]
MGNRKWQVSLSLVNLVNLATILEELFETLQYNPDFFKKSGFFFFDKKIFSQLIFYSLILPDRSLKLKVSKAERASNKSELNRQQPAKQASAS